MNFNAMIIDGNITILETMNIIYENGKGVAYLCDDGCLIGVVTDGDIRRHILNNGRLDEEIQKISNKTPLYLEKNDIHNFSKVMKENSISSIPVIDEKKRIISIKFSNGLDVYNEMEEKLPVVIMAGGKGTRLYPYTKILPKPLIPVGEKTIIEHIMDRFSKFGCDSFKIIVNYKKEFIKSYFYESEDKRNIKFVDEREFLGTGGGLSLLRNELNSTFIMTNCDVLIDGDYADMYKYHKNEGNLVTMICALKNTTIPYGTIQLDKNGKIQSMKEKPSFSFLVNTGIYIMEPQIFNYINDNEFIHITEVIQRCMNEQKSIGVYPISDSAWMDMGQMSELEKMREKLDRYEKE